MTRVLGVAFAPFPENGHNAALQAFSALNSDSWAIDGCAFDLLVVRCGWWSAMNALDQCVDPDAIVLFASADRRESIEIVRSARNEARLAHRDADGMAWPGSELAPGAAPIVSATLSADALARAMEFSGAPAVIVEQCPADVVNRVFYGLARRRRTLVGLVRLPLSLESARAEGAYGTVNRMQILAGVKAALQFAAAAAEARQCPDSDLLKATEAG